MFLIFLGVIALAFVLIISKCKLVGHQWEHFVHGRQCAWCNKHQKEWACE